MRHGMVERRKLSSPSPASLFSPPPPPPPLLPHEGGGEGEEEVKRSGGECCKWRNRACSYTGKCSKRAQLLYMIPYYECPTHTCQKSAKVEKDDKCLNCPILS